MVNCRGTSKQELRFSRLDSFHVWPDFAPRSIRQERQRFTIMATVSLLALSQGLLERPSKCVSQQFDRWNPKWHGRLFSQRNFDISFLSTGSLPLRSYFGPPMRFVHCGVVTFGRTASTGRFCSWSIGPPNGHGTSKTRGNRGARQVFRVFPGFQPLPDLHFSSNRLKFSRFRSSFRRLFHHLPRKEVENHGPKLAHPCHPAQERSPMRKWPSRCSRLSARRAVRRIAGLR